MTLQRTAITCTCWRNHTVVRKPLNFPVQSLLPPGWQGAARNGSYNKDQSHVYDVKVLKIRLLFSIAGLLAVVCKTAWETTLTSHWKKKKKTFKLGCFFTFNFSSAAHIQARPKSSIFSHNFSDLWFLFSPYPCAVVTWPIADHTSPSHSPTPCLSPWPELSSHQHISVSLGFPSGAALSTLSHSDLLISPSELFTVLSFSLLSH